MRAVPSYPGLRLFADSSAAAQVIASETDVTEYSEKRRVVPGADRALFRTSSAPVGRVYVLSPGDHELAMVRRSQRDAAIDLVKHTYRIDTAPGPGLRAQLDLVAGASQALDVWRLAYPRDLPNAGVVARAIAAHAVASGRFPLDGGQD